MTAAFLLSAFLTLPALQARRAPTPAFRPHFGVKIQPAGPGRGRTVIAEDREIICGMVVVHKTPDGDRGILMAPRETGSVIRRIEPQACSAKPVVPAK